MDERSVRAQLVETKDRLRQVDEEREILLSLIHGFEGWLRLHGAALPDIPHGSVSMRSAVRRVLQEAHGAPIHTKEILKRAMEIGASTQADRPESVVDLTALTLSKKEPVERVGPRTWRWAGTNNVRISDVARGTYAESTGSR